MSVKVIWTETAIRDLDLIYDFLSEKSHRAAIRQIEKILKRESQLIQQPQSGQIQPLKNLKKEFRYLVEGNYKIIYHKAGNFIYIDTIFDTRQNPEKLG